MYKIVTLLPKKEANVAFRHPWIFSGALASIPDDLEHGELVTVKDKNDKILGTGTYSNKSSIAVRVLEFGDAKIDKDWFGKKLKDAAERREVMGYGGKDTTAYRVLFGESDGVPGLVVDRYEDVIVFQIATAGLDRLRDEIVAAIVATLKPRAVVERSDQSVRREEGLEPNVGIRFGEEIDEVEYVESGVTFAANVLSGQKTGAFLDQKDLRAAIGKLADGNTVLNLFSYSGATGIAAMKGGAESVHNVDGSDDALAGCAKNAKLNKISEKHFTTENSDVFQWLDAHQDVSFDMVILDPPALIKSMRDSEEGKKAYHFLNRAAMRIVKSGGILVTSSCSHFLPEEDLAFILRRASVQAGVQLDVLNVIRQSPDHPQSVYFPEAAYLKTFICRISR
jgi:23S rRNA (cytosine1962-C5)-methyltransferase